MIPNMLIFYYLRRTDAYYMRQQASESVCHSGTRKTKGLFLYFSEILIKDNAWHERRR